MRKVIAPLYDNYREGLTCGQREHVKGIAVLFKLDDGTDLVEWYRVTDLEFNV